MDTRTALLNSAETAARQRGYDGFSYADLARDVGIRKASIHYHFPTKTNLVLELTDRYAAQFTDALSSIDAAKTTAASRLQAYHAIYRGALAGGTQLCLCVVLSAGRDSLTDPVLNRLSQFHHDSIAWLHGAYSMAAKDGSVSNLADPKAEAHAALALMEGAQLLSRAAKNITPFDQATAVFLSRLSPEPGN